MASSTTSPLVSASPSSSPALSLPISLSDGSSQSQSASDPGVSNSASASDPGSVSNVPSSDTGSSSMSVPPSSVLQSPSVSVGQSTILSTSNGVVVTETLQVTSTLPPGTTVSTSANTTSSDSGSSHAGAIAGGVVGGVAFLLAIIFLVWFLRRRSKEREEAELFDGNFDPSRTTDPTLPRMSSAGGTQIEDDGVGGRLAASTIGGGVVTPFMAGVGAGSGQASQPYYEHGHPQMQQYYDSGVTSSDIPVSPTTTGSNYYYASGSTTGTSAYPMSTSASSAGYSNPMSAKEREARGGAFAVANPNPTGRPTSIGMPGPSNAMPSLPNPHSPSGSSAGVVVHTDGGRVPEPDSAPNEIPPTYDSIRQ